MRQVVIAHGGVDMSSGEASLASLGAACDLWMVNLGANEPTAAVVSGIGVLEDDVQFNAGYGSVLTADGTVEVDAAVVDGTSGRYGGVGAARGLRHPARVAELVLRSPGAVLLSGHGAEQFASRHGEGYEDLRTPEQQQVWESTARGETVSPFTGRTAAPSTETVGCIAVRGSSVAAASSTGGVFGKPVGRIGDSAILGAGLWADSSSAVLCSGEGEAMISLQLARRVADRIAAGDTAANATRWGVRLAGSELAAVSAVVAVSVADIDIAAAHSGASFPVVASNGRRRWVVESTRVEVG